MFKGFFEKVPKSLRKPTPKIPRCGSCKLNKDCNSPKMATVGQGKRSILIVTQSPGYGDEEHNGWLFGYNNKPILEKTLKSLGVDPLRDCWLTGAIICYPGKGNKITDNQIGYCRPNLLKTIAELKPKTIILLGSSPVQSLIGYLWKESPGSIDRWVGWKIPSQRLNAWVCPIYHPSSLENNEIKPDTKKIMELWFKSHLKAAIKLKGRPWDEVPDYKRRVKIWHNEGMVEGLLNSFVKIGHVELVAFDYECNYLKPDKKAAEIFCCSIAWMTEKGARAIVYPWTRATSKATSKLLRSRVPKVAQNLKYENRWSKAILGHGVRNWKWDTMQAAHILDNRRGITGLKFQSFVLLGQESYDDHIKPFLESEKPGEENTIKQAPLDQVLTYCGLDSILTLEIAIKQMEEMKMEL